MTTSMTPDMASGDPAVFSVAVFCHCSVELVGGGWAVAQ